MQAHLPADDGEPEDPLARQRLASLSASASTMNMYGPHALPITEALTAGVACDLGYPAEVLLIYQASYAVATANAFTPDGSDGHFAWCLTRLRRPDIAGVLGL